MSKKGKNRAISPLADDIFRHVSNIKKARPSVPKESLDMFDNMTAGGEIVSSLTKVFEAGKNLRDLFKK